LLSTLGEIHSSDSNGKFIQYYDYNQKLIDRFNSFEYANYGLSDEEFFSIKKSVQSLNGEYKIIHGDLVFSNIILTNTGKIRLIDVKGKQGNDLSIFGDCFYDYAKIYQSLIGYDEILLDKEIKESYKNKMINHFDSKFSNEDLQKIKNITKSLLVSLIPLHNEPKKFKKYINLAKK
jgi:thiamine kinase-like enzyme